LKIILYNDEEPYRFNHKKKQGKNCGARSIGIKMKEIKAYMSVLELE